MSKLDILKMFQQKELPRLFYGYKEITKSILTSNDSIYAYLDLYCNENKLNNPYNKEQFSRTNFQYEDTLICKITLLDSYIYLFFNKELDALAYYFTLDTDKENIYYADHNLNISSHEMTSNDLDEAVLKLYTNKN